MCVKTVKQLFEKEKKRKLDTNLNSNFECFTQSLLITVFYFERLILVTKRQKKHDKSHQREMEHSFLGTFII